MKNKILEKLLNEVEEYAKILIDTNDNCIHHYNIEISYLFYPELQQSNTKPMIKNKLKDLLSELKNRKVQAILVLKYKTRNDHNIFHLNTKLIASDSDIDKVFRSMHESIKIKTQKIC